MDDARHPQTILAYELNDKPLPVENGHRFACVERQLGYKHAKYVMRIELVDSFAKIAGGTGTTRLPVVRGSNASLWWRFAAGCTGFGAALGRAPSLHRLRCRQACRPARDGFQRGSTHDPL